MTDFSPRFIPVRYVTEDVPAIGGAIKQRLDDFIVEEIPLYNPAGEGEHLYMMIEKRGMTAMELNRLVARHFRVPVWAVGYAGLKDRSAVTRQVISVHIPGRDAGDFPSLEHPRARVLWVDRHTNKLRRGHLAANRFSIRIRGVPPTAAVSALRVLRTLERVGVPDRVGAQRFGYLQNNHLVGRALYRGDFQGVCDLLCGPSGLAAQGPQAEARALYANGDFAGARAAMPRRFTTERDVLEALAAGETPEQAVGGIEPGVMSYYFSAFQSAVFNAALDRRVGEGLLGELLVGDVACRHGLARTERTLFDVDEPVLADPKTAARLAALEISATGPMWGTAMRAAGGVPGEHDRAALAESGLSVRDLDAAGLFAVEMTRGTRRPYRVPISNVEVEGGVDEHGPYVRCAFDLPSGAFATTVMSEVMKTQSPPGEEGLMDPEEAERS